MQVPRSRIGGCTGIQGQRLELRRADFSGRKNTGHVRISFNRQLVGNAVRRIDAGIQIADDGIAGNVGFAVDFGSAAVNRNLAVQQVQIRSAGIDDAAVFAVFQIAVGNRKQCSVLQTGIIDLEFVCQSRQSAADNGVATDSRAAAALNQQSAVVAAAFVGKIGLILRRNNQLVDVADIVMRAAVGAELEIGLHLVQFGRRRIAAHINAVQVVLVVAAAPSFRNRLYRRCNNGTVGRCNPQFAAHVVNRPNTLYAVNRNLAAADLRITAVGADHRRNTRCAQHRKVALFLRFCYHKRRYRLAAARIRVFENDFVVFAESFGILHIARRV